MNCVICGKGFDPEVGYVPVPGLCHPVHEFCWDEISGQYEREGRNEWPRSTWRKICPTSPLAMAPGPPVKMEYRQFII